jgi:hypothetical protein
LNNIQAPVAQLDRAVDYGSAHACFANSFNFSIRRAELKQVKLCIILTFTGFSESYRILGQKKAQIKHKIGLVVFFTNPMCLVSLLFNLKINFFRFVTKIIQNKEIYDGKKI